MEFETDAAAVYQSRTRHYQEEVQGVIPASYAGIRVTDQGHAYDSQAYDGVDQQEWLAQILRPISDAMAIKTGRAHDLGEQLKGLLQDPQALWHAHRDGTGTDFMVDAEALQAMTTYQLHDRRLDDPDHQQMLIALGWHHDRGNLLHFLANPRIEPTNYRAERALRATDIARKVSRDLRKDRGTHTFAVFMSVVRTLAKHNGEFLVENLYHLFRPSSLQNAPP